MAKRKRPEFPMEFETFYKLTAYARGNLVQREPSCFNGGVRVRRYRVTVEELDETKEVLQARLQKLWDDSRNSHDIGPIKETAKELGVELKGPWRVKR